MYLNYPCIIIQNHPGTNFIPDKISAPIWHLTEHLFSFPDLLLSWLFIFPPPFSIAISGLLTGLICAFFAGPSITRGLLAEAGRDLKILSKKSTEYRDSLPPEKNRNDGSANLPNKKLVWSVRAVYFLEMAKLLLTVIPLLCFMAFWTGTRFQFKPPLTGTPLKLLAIFSNDSEGTVWLVPEPWFKITGSPLKKINPSPDFENSFRRRKISQKASSVEKPQVLFEILPQIEGNIELTLCHGLEKYSFKVNIGSRHVKASSRIIEFHNNKGLQKVILLLDESIPVSAWNLYLGWAGVYIFFVFLSFSLTLACLSTD